MTWDIDKAGERTRRMWLKLGKALEKQALETVEDFEHVETAVRFAALADCCFYQATGEADAFDLRRDFIGKEQAK